MDNKERETIAWRVKYLSLFRPPLILSLNSDDLDFALHHLGTDKLSTNYVLTNYVLTDYQPQNSGIVPKLEKIIYIT